jgi:3-deoxy-D-manno-octulosonic-acid transferase
MGMLSRLFAYGDIAFIGGGFQKGGIHNILEPAVFGLPIIFGPVYEKFVEAKKMVSLHYVFPVNNAAESSLILKKLISDEAYRRNLNISIKAFMQEHTGATGAIMNRIRMEEWLK